MLNLQVMDEEEHKISWMKKIFIETGQKNQRKYLKEVLKFADCWICSELNSLHENACTGDFQFNSVVGVFLFSPMKV